MPSSNRNHTLSNSSASPRSTSYFDATDIVYPISSSGSSLPCVLNQKTNGQGYLVPRNSSLSSPDPIGSERPSTSRASGSSLPCVLNQKTNGQGYMVPRDSSLSSPDPIGSERPSTSRASGSSLPCVLYQKNNDKTYMLPRNSSLPSPDPIGSERPSTSRASGSSLPCELNQNTNGQGYIALKNLSLQSPDPIGSERPSASRASGLSLPCELNQNTNGQGYIAPINLSLPSVFNMEPNELPFSNIPNKTFQQYYCNAHGELLNRICLPCRKMVCQCCTLHEHKDHTNEPLHKFAAEAPDHINNALEKSAHGNIHIRQCIDSVFTQMRNADRNIAEVADVMQKYFREYIMAIEDRQRVLMESLNRAHRRVTLDLDGQMAGYKSTLKGVAETAEKFAKLKQTMDINSLDFVKSILEGQRQLDQFVVTANDLTPKEKLFAFIGTDDFMLRSVRKMGDVTVYEKKDDGLFYNGAGVRIIKSSSPIAVPNNNPPEKSPNLACASGWDINIHSKSQPECLTQAIPGYCGRVRAYLSTSLSLSFATEGHRDGQVSRPWGLCVNKIGNILISDRRNNRVQVFHMDGTFFFNFGRKGVGNGEFDLPAGICVDTDGRIIVVDKDNHRVQIFTSSGVYLSKFGSYGHEYGQFQYPWDVAVNHRRQIAVTDSRNHRVQQFDSEGRFIRQIIFDNCPSPRGICYTPTGNIIVTDFDNHCLYLIDPDVNKILAVQGREGPHFKEFNRPSGVCCDDDGRIIVADSKNKRIVVFSPNMEFLWMIEVGPCMGFATQGTFNEKDRTCDVAVMPDGRIAFLIELSPDSKAGFNPAKRFVHLF